MIETSLCYLEKDGKYLMLYRNKKTDDPNRDKWIGIGGKCLLAETPEACMRREVHEETDLTIEQSRFCGIVNFRSGTWEEVMYLFHATAWQGKLRASTEGEFAWIKKEDMEHLPMWEGDHIFLDLIEKEHPFFELTLIYNGETLEKAVLDGILLER